jgi:hypothetical protein
LIRFGGEGNGTVNDNNRRRLSIKDVMIVIAMIAILAIVAAITSPGYLERLAGLMASLVSLAVIVREFRS